MLVTSSVTDMRLKAWMAASCTDSVVAGCLMHFISVVLMAASAASIASPMLPTTWMKESQQLEKKHGTGRCYKKSKFCKRVVFTAVTYPQGHEGQILLPGTVCTQDGIHEVGDGSDLRGDALSLVQSSDKFRH